MSDTVDITTKEVKVTESEKLDFYKAFLADKPYAGSIDLFGGKFKVVFSSLTVKQTQDIFEQIRKDQIKDEISTDANYMMTLTNYRLGQALVSINDEPFRPELGIDKYKPKDENDSYIKAKGLVFADWPVFKLSALADAFKQFEDKLVYLTREVQTENFWEADQ